MKWTELPAEGEIPAPRYGHSLAAHAASSSSPVLVLFGGTVPHESPLVDGAATGPIMPPFAAGMSWAAGGATDGSLFILQTTSLKWSRPNVVGVAPTPRVFHSACVAPESGSVARDTLVIFGGSGNASFTEPLNDLHLLDLSSMQWSSPVCSGEVPSPRYGHKMIHVEKPDDQLLLFGGTSGGRAEEGEAGSLYALKLSTGVWSRVTVSGTPPLERSFHSFDLIGKWAFVFAGQTSSTITDLYILDVANQRWAKPLYEGQVNVRAHASAVLHDKLIVFGGVRDKAPSSSGRRSSDAEQRISKKLFFLNVLEVKGSVAEGDFKFKMVTVGDSGVGKSCLLTRFVQDWYSDFHVSTIGVDFKTVITMVKGRLVKLQLWDTAGQERFSVVTGNYYRNSDGFIFVYDATNRASFDHVEQWLGQVQQHHECGSSTIKILVANKSDMAGEIVVSEAEGQAKATQIGAFFVSTSAKTAANVDMAFLTAAQNLVEIRRKQKQQPKTLQLGSTPPPSAAGGSSSSGSKPKCAGCKTG